jgi:hypothetical protein
LTVVIAAGIDLRDLQLLQRLFSSPCKTCLISGCAWASVLDESLYKPRVAFLVLGVLGLLYLETKELVLLLHCLCVVYAITKLGGHFKVLGSHISHFHL